MSSWFLLIIVTMALGFGTQAYINSSYRKYASVPNESGIIFYAFAVLFQIVPLPVEFNASRRALAYITGSSSGAVTASTQALAIPGDATADGARTVLRAAALTYVAAALTSVLQLLYFLGMVRGD